MSPAGHTFQQEVPSLLLSEKSGTESRAVFGSGLWEPQPGGDFLKRNLWGLKYTRAHAPRGSGQLWVAGSWGRRLQVEGQEGPKRQEEGVRPAESSALPNVTRVLSRPGYFQGFGESRGCAPAGESGKNESKFQKGELSVLQYH